MQSQAINPPAQTRLEALKARHTQLSMRIEREQKRPGAMDGLLKSLKKQKLASCHRGSACQASRFIARQ